MRLFRLSVFAIVNLQRSRLAYAELSSKDSSINPVYGIQQVLFSSYSANMTRLAPVICVAHGGGPLPLLGDPSHKALAHSMRTKVPQILKLGTPEQPKAIVLVTAHWATHKVSISSGSKHDLLFDYSGFPPETYQYKHDAPGSPEVAELVEKALKEAGIESRKDSRRGWDHGVFIPMKMIDPQAKVPIVQVSILASESAPENYALGRALFTLRSQNIAIVGSGFATFHNFGIMRTGIVGTPQWTKQTTEWSNAVGNAATTVDDATREKKFGDWRSWPGNHLMHHPGHADHFVPLIVCAGAAGTSQGKKYADEFLGFDIWTYYWE